MRFDSHLFASNAIASHIDRESDCQSNLCVISERQEGMIHAD